MLNRASLAAPDGPAIAKHLGNDDIVAVRGQVPISRADFNRDIAGLAARLPNRPHVLNMCADRYRFMVGLAAARQRRQITLLPPGDAPGMIAAIAADYPDAYALTQGGEPPMPSLIYPEDLHGDIAPRPAALPNQPPAPDHALVLFTSGSTGRPKPAPKSWATLTLSARAAGERLGIAPLAGGTLVGTVPHQHSYGLESLILLGLQHGLIVDAGWPLYPADIRAALQRAAPPRILVTTPIHLKALLAEPEPMPRVDLILSATAPLAAALAAEAEARFGATLIEIYGCTEAGQLATRRGAHETEWRCLDGVELTHDGCQSWASGPAVPGRVALQDVLEPTGRATFRLGGRAADLVDVAGKRGSLAHLNQQLLDISGVEDGVFVMEENDGQRVARLMALVVAPSLAAETVLRALRQRIDAAFLPRPLIFVDKLPRNPLGKLPREALLRLAASLGRG